MKADRIPRASSLSVVPIKMDRATPRGRSRSFHLIQRQHNRRQTSPSRNHRRPSLSQAHFNGFSEAALKLAALYHHCNQLTDLLSAHNNESHKLIDEKPSKCSHCGVEEEIVRKLHSSHPELSALTHKSDSNEEDYSFQGPFSLQQNIEPFLSWGENTKLCPTCHWLYEHKAEKEKQYWVEKNLFLIASNHQFEIKKEKM
eukprot:TRINITY_DN1941_c0_g1_i12.p1 TRINITY_DN1941_c0_g1~~TRINITY_DN1941_c0_g1_i12.p1  ORF type:complete len:200 (+),score=29.37 TRINITY_DN1941_c0_g1_i12:2733-3332(+)